MKQLLRRGFLFLTLFGSVIPSGLYAAPGDLYLTDVSTGTIAKYSSSGAPTTFGSDNFNFTGVAFDSKGNVFAGGAGGAIFKFTPGGTKSLFASGVPDADGLAFDKAGNLFVANYSSTNGTITKITPAGTKTLFASGLNGPIGLAFDKAGNLYEADQSSGKVFKFSASGTKTLFASGFSTPFGPRGLAFDSSGNLFVSDHGAGTIFKVTPAGTKTTFATGIDSPEGIAFDSSGNLYVADGITDSILLFTATGARSTFLALGNDRDPSFIAFEPVLHHLLNISTRAFVQTGDNALIAGFIVGGNGQVDGTVVVRAIGPSLSAFGVTGAVQDTTLELRNAAGSQIAFSDDWKAGGQQAEIVATGLQPSNDRESALVALLPAGNYTAVVRGYNNTTGVALVEVYNLQ